MGKELKPAEGSLSKEIKNLKRNIKSLENQIELAEKDKELTKRLIEVKRLNQTVIKPNFEFELLPEYKEIWLEIQELEGKRTINNLDMMIDSDKDRLKDYKESLEELEQVE